MKANSIEEVINFLEKQGIETNYKQGEGTNFNRTIEIKLEGATYFIEWWVNQCYFRFGSEYGAPFVPFKYIGVNPNSPTIRHHDQLCFYDVQNENRGILHSPIPFGCLKLPFNRLKK